MNDKVLFVDDDKTILETFERALALDYDISTAEGGVEALKLVEAEGPFAVIVSDMRMPGMSGVEFLSEVRKRWPDSVRVMLTGYADMDAAVAAVNEGQVFRFLTKPCPPGVLMPALDSCLEQYRLIMAERELLRGTLRGSIKVLSETLSIARPEIYGQVTRVQPYVKAMAQKLGDPAPWAIETAANLALLGFIGLPDRIINLVIEGKRLLGIDASIFAKHPETADRLIANIPRLESVRSMVRYQNKNFDGTGLPMDDVRGEKIPLGARILHVGFDFDALVQTGLNKNDAYLALTHRLGFYDPKVLAALEKVLGEESRYVIRDLLAGEITEGMILAEDVIISREGRRIKVLSKGQQLGQTNLEYLRNFAHEAEWNERIKVIVPRSTR